MKTGRPKIHYNGQVHSMRISENIWSLIPGVKSEFINAAIKAALQKAGLLSRNGLSPKKSKGAKNETL